MVTISECASHVVVAAEIGPMSSGEQTMARQLYPGLEPDWLLIGDRNFYGYHDWNTARAGGAALLWRVSASVTLPVLAASSAMAIYNGNGQSVYLHRHSMKAGARPAFGGNDGQSSPAAWHREPGDPWLPTPGVQVSRPWRQIGFTGRDYGQLRAMGPCRQGPIMIST